MSKHYKISKAEILDKKWGGGVIKVLNGETFEFDLGDQATDKFRFADSDWIKNWRCTPNLSVSQCLQVTSPVNRKKLLLTAVAANGFDATFTLTIRDTAGVEYDMDPEIQQPPK